MFDGCGEGYLGLSAKGIRIRCIRRGRVSSAVAAVVSNKGADVVLTSSLLRDEVSTVRILRRFALGRLRNGDCSTPVLVEH